MKYYAIYDNDRLVSIGSTSNDSAVLENELTETEHNALLTEIRLKAELVDKLYNGEITEADIPSEYAEEVIRRVEERRAEEEAYLNGEATAEDIAIGLEGLL